MENTKIGFVGLGNMGSPMATNIINAGLELFVFDAAGTAVHTVIGGSGPPLLLLHGYPQTHAIWHRVAPLLAERFTVVATDLRGYGDSSKPPGGGGRSPTGRSTTRS